MASEHSYSITISNNRTENAAIKYLRNADSSIVIPDSKSRKTLLDGLGLPSRFIRTFDAVRVASPIAPQGNLVDVPLNQIQLIELKTTQKYLPNLPFGFFFGATENEFELARILKSKFMFCFISLHQDSPIHQYVSLEELETLTKSKRIQYQIQLRRQ